MPHFGSKEFERYLNFDLMEDTSKKTDFCCKKMGLSVAYVCNHDHDKWACGDVLIHYNEVFDEYGLVIHDGGASYVGISFCPWCGQNLPTSKRDLWFDQLEALGFSDPLEQDIPSDYKSGNWYTK